VAYDPPIPADLKLRYPAFTGLDDDTIWYWLEDAGRFVDQTWSEGDYAPALIAVAAHNMLDAGVPGIAGSDMAGLLAAGVTDFKSGTFQARLSDEAVKQAIAGGYESTRPGQEYLRLLARNKGGPRVTAPGHLPIGLWPFPA